VVSQGRARHRSRSSPPEVGTPAQSHRLHCHTYATCGEMLDGFSRARSYSWHTGAEVRQRLGGRHAVRMDCGDIRAHPSPWQAAPYTSCPARKVRIQLATDKENVSSSVLRKLGMLALVVVSIMLIFIWK
jgi:hypothetical protein